MGLTLWEEAGKKQNQLQIIKLNKMAKLKKQELEDLRTKVDKVNKLQIQIGGLELQKHDLLHATMAAVSDLESVQKDLKEIYGEITVNIDTGEIKEDATDKED